MHFRRRFWPWLAAWTVLGLGIRLATVYGRPNRPPGGDPYFYFKGAQLLVEGYGFINPFDYFWLHPHQYVQSAAFPPGYLLALTIPMVFGFKTFFAARIWSCVLGAAAVTVGGLAGREMAGRRVGLIAALLIAVYPNIWMPDEIGAAETLDPLMVAWVLLCAYRFWKRRDLRSAIWLGVSLAVTTLVRDELSLLVLFILVPMALLLRPLAWKRRLGLLGVGLLAAAVVVAPWVGYNMSRFEKTTFISNGLGVTMASSDCNKTFSGYDEGYWWMYCATSIPKVSGDESVQDAHDEHVALTYLRHHEGRILPVSLAKLGRAFGFFRPGQQLRFDSLIETRPYRWAVVGLIMYYCLLALSVVGTVILRKRRIPVFPLWAIGLNVAIAVIISFGDTRYRVPFEVPLVLMGSVTIEWLWTRLRPQRRAAVPPEAVPVEPEVAAHA